MHEMVAFLDQIQIDLPPKCQYTAGWLREVPASIDFSYDPLSLSLRCVAGLHTGYFDLILTILLSFPKVVAMLDQLRDTSSGLRGLESGTRLLASARITSRRILGRQRHGPLSRH